MTSTDDDTALDILTRRLDEIRLAAETVKTYGECMRLLVFVREARAEFLERVGEEVAARQIMWSVRYDKAWNYVEWKYRTLSDTSSLPIMVEATVPTIETFFDTNHYACLPPKPEHRELYIRQMAEAEERLGIRIDGFVRDLLTYRNGGHTNFDLHPRLPWSRLDYRNVENHPEDGHGYSPFQKEWEYVFNDRTIASVQYWQTVERFTADELDRYEREGYWMEADLNWREKLPGMDKLVILCMQENRHTWDLNMTCLDYRRGPHPGLVVLDADRFATYFEIKESWPCFETLFYRLRRWPLREIDGAVRKRGPYLVDIFDEGKWRATRY